MDELKEVFDSLPREKQVYAELMFYVFVASLEKDDGVKIRKFKEGFDSIVYQVEVQVRWKN